mmetsp:Transcript_25211/g.22340  ORF Transcript_25211/g.22340 Transcript_25211/m.22340 type:complete len:143 (+) Transcript_25211:874-1302(+)
MDLIDMFTVFPNIKNLIFSTSYCLYIIINNQLLTDAKTEFQKIQTITCGDDKKDKLELDYYQDNAIIAIKIETETEIVYKYLLVDSLTVHASLGQFDQYKDSLVIYSLVKYLKFQKFREVEYNQNLSDIFNTHSDKNILFLI